MVLPQLAIRGNRDPIPVAIGPSRPESKACATAIGDRPRADSRWPIQGLGAFWRLAGLVSEIGILVLLKCVILAAPGSPVRGTARALTSMHTKAAVELV